jgi:hypothetical protein
MANHGYISRDGITTFAEAANACQITLGFGYDTCTFLSALGLLAGGDLATGKMSIGGADSRVPNTLGPALGISHHGPFEIDQSISRSDTYFGNNANFNLTRFNRIVDIADENGGQFGLDTWNQERQLTYTESRDTNPEFDAGAKHLAVSLAERVFIYRALPNGTDETNANFANIAPFFLNETFPPFWFRRGTPYSLPNVADDILALYLAGPTELGSNQGLNNFVPLGTDFGSLSSAEVLCFLEENMLDILPGQFSTAITGELTTVQAFVNGAIAPFFATEGCAVDWTAAGKSAGTTIKGTSAKSGILVDGVYLQSAPSYTQIP